MRQTAGRIVLGVLLVVGLSACATDYGIKAGGPHFASWEHMKYSIFWTGEKPPLSTTGQKLAKDEGWWGIPVQYESNEVKQD